MNNITKKSTALLLSMLTLGALLAGCAGDSGASSDTSAQDVGDTTVETTVAETEYITHKSAGLEVTDFGGHEFGILAHKRAADDRAWWYIDREQIDGEVLNDAIYTRNANIENAYNVAIEAIYVDNITTSAPQLILAGDTSFEVMFGSIQNTASLMLKSLTTDFNTVENIDLSREWWDREIIRDWTLDGELHVLTGDISPSINMRVYAMAFNKDLCDSLGIDYPYQTVLDGKWTLDYFKSFVKGINADLNGDGVMDYDDRWGFLAVSGESTKQLISCGGKQTEVVDGKLKFVLGDEKNMTRFIDTLETVADPEVTILADPYASANGWTAVSSWFANGGALLKASCFEDIPKDLRSMETDFGILPYPKYDEAQDEYVTLVANSGYVLSIPTSVADTSRTGYILEVMSAESVNTVTPALYDVSLEGKTARDDESTLMLDIIFKNKFYDIAYNINLGGIWTMVDELEAGKSDSVASSIESYRERINKAADDLMAAVAK